MNNQNDGPLKVNERSYPDGGKSIVYGKEADDQGTITSKDHGHLTIDGSGKISSLKTEGDNRILVNEKTDSKSAYLNDGYFMNVTKVVIEFYDYHFSFLLYYYGTRSSNKNKIRGITKRISKFTRTSS